MNLALIFYEIYVFVILYRQTVTAAASVAWVAACRALVETRRVNVFMAQEWRRLADETVKREAQVCFAPMPSVAIDFGSCWL